MTKDPFESSANLTQKRKDYAKRLFVGCCQSLASDLDQGEVTEEVGIFALGQMLAAYTPHTGEGHASATRAWVADQVAALRTPDAAQEAPAHTGTRGTGTRGTGTRGTGTRGTGTRGEARPS
jgi:hypothetical protein